MFVKNGKRFNLNAYLGGTYTDDNGIQHPGQLLRDPDFRASLGITEIADPARGNDATQYTQEIDVDPWVIIVDKSQEQLDVAFNADVTRQINVLEAGSFRALREASLGNTTQLQLIDTQISTLRASYKRDANNVVIGSITAGV